MKKILWFLALILVFFSFFWETSSARNSLFNNTTNQIPYCKDGECWIDQWVDAIRDINVIETQRTASQYIQDIAQYILNFLAFIAIFVIMYAWFKLLFWMWEEDAAKKSKQIIIYAILWLVIIYIAWPLIDFVIWILNA